MNSQTSEIRTGEVIVRAVDVEKSFGHVSVLHGVSLDIAKGEVIVIVGPSARQDNVYSMHKPA